MRVSDNRDAGLCLCGFLWSSEEISVMPCVPRLAAREADSE